MKLKFNRFSSVVLNRQKCDQHDLTFRILASLADARVDSDAIYPPNKDCVMSQPHSQAPGNEVA